MKLSTVWKTLMRRSGDRASDAPRPIRESITDAGYFEEVSVRYASAQLIGIVLLAVFLAVSLLTDSSLLSANSLAFFAKDMTASVSLRERAARDTLVYTSDEDNRFATFRGGLSVLGDEKLTVFTATGRQSYTDYISYATPRLASSGRYLIAYDLGGTSYRLYNSFACVEQGKTDFPIRTVAAANNGLYAIVTDDAEYASLVTLSNERYQVINRYHMEQYTVCAALDEAGERLALASVSLQNGRMTTHLLLAEPGQGQAEAEWTVDDVYPVALSLTENGNVVLLSTDCAIWFDEDGEEIARYSFAPESVRSFRTGAFGCALLCRANAYDADTRVLTFDKNGREVYNVTVEQTVLDLTLYDGTLALLLDGTLQVYRDGEATPTFEAPLTAKYRALFANAQDEFTVCGDAKAIVVRAFFE